MKTLIIIILDESLSMDRKKLDVIGGFNNFIRDQKEIKNDVARLYFVKFNTIVTTVHSGIPLEEVPELSTTNYTPIGNTALYDAIAYAVSIADKDKTGDERVICVIMTDGQENSSQSTTKEQVRNIISGHEARGDWTFLYIGENPDLWTRDTGMSASHGISYNHVNPAFNFEILGQSVCDFRSSEGSQVKHGLFDIPRTK